MDLTDEQKQAVKGWVAEGMALAEVQRRLQEDFGLKMTFMEVRFLIDDLNVDVVDKPEPKKEEDVNAATLEPEAVPGGVTVEVDKVQRPGAMLSGTVKFSDGNSMGWQLDQMGRLGLLPGSNKEYRPSEEDIAEFQLALQQELQKSGF